MKDPLFPLRYLAPLLITIFSGSKLLAQCSEPDYLPLVALYESTNGADWEDNSGWLSDCDLCNWVGVACDSNSRVVGLALPGNNLSGRIPVEIGQLTEIQSLDLSGNGLFGVLPNSLGALSNLENLRLQVNFLSGEIPAIFGGVKELARLNLGQNNFSGRIPADLGALTSLSVLDLAANQLSGEIPAELGNLPDLTILDLSKNDLSGCFPGSFSNFCGSQAALDFSENPGLAPVSGDLDLFCAESAFPFSLISCSNTESTKEIEISVENTNVIEPDFGALLDMGANRFLIFDVPLQQDLTLNIGCRQEEVITDLACNCIAVEVAPPVALQDTVNSCPGEPVELIAMVPGTATIDWYDAPRGGNLIAAGIPSISVADQGDYYAEARSLENGCLSRTRTSVTLVLSEIPDVSLNPEGGDISVRSPRSDFEIVCSDDLMTYSVLLTTDADIVEASSGMVSSPEPNSVLISGIPANDDLMLTLSYASSPCFETLAFSAGNCSCDLVNIEPPLSLGDLLACAGEEMPALLVTTSGDETVDWYDAAAGGNLLAVDTPSFTPGNAGVYYAEARSLLNGCISTVRTPVVLEEVVLPDLNFGAEGPTCSPDLFSYSVNFGSAEGIDITVSAGTLVSGGMNSYTVIDIPAALDLVIRASDQNSCVRETTLSAPNCSCESTPVAPPVSQGDQVICEGDPIPELSVSVATELTADWYDAMSGGNLLRQGSANFFPPGAGVYYAEARNIFSGCVTSTRTAVSLILDPLPSFEAVDEVCAADSLSYSISFNTDAEEVSASIGVLNDLGNLGFRVDGIPPNQDLTLSLTDLVTNCLREEVYEAPRCQCQGLVTVAAPISTGDRTACSSDPIPALEVLVGEGETVDWYSAEIGGELLAVGTPAYVAGVTGTYFAETRRLDNGCISEGRTAVQLTINEVPSFTLPDNGLTCSLDLETYNVAFSTDGEDILASGGVVLDNGGESYDVVGIPESVNLTLRLGNLSTGCEREVVISGIACDCAKLGIAAPVSNGDQVICAGEPIPALEVVVPEGTSVDWYDAPSGGTLLAEDTTVFIPTVDGTYYAESRLAENGCVSGQREAVSLTINPVPTFDLDFVECNLGGDEYRFKFATDANQVAIDPRYTLLIDGNSFSVSGIPTGDTVALLLTDSGTGCRRLLPFFHFCPISTYFCGPAFLEVTAEETKICKGDSTLLVSNILDPIFEDSFEWYDNPALEGVPIGDEPDLLVKPEVTTTYYLSYTYSFFSCDDFAPVVNLQTEVSSIQIEVTPVPELALDSIVCFNDTYPPSSGAFVRSNGTLASSDSSRITMISEGSFLLTDSPEKTVEVIAGIDFCTSELLIDLPGFDECTTCRTRDSMALVMLYEQTGGAEWLVSWDLQQPFSTWFGVVVDPASGCVTEIRLADNNLTGTIPPELFRYDQWSNLQILDLSNNSLQGSIPASINSLPQLSALDLSANNFTFEGLIPFYSGAASNPNLLLTISPQNPIPFQETIIELEEGDDNSIRLFVDAALRSNVYVWNKNAGFYHSVRGRDVLSWNDIDPSDAGRYVCSITNPAVPVLVLETEVLVVRVLESPSFVLNISDITGNKGELVCAEVRSRNILPIDSISYSLLWDNEVLQFRRLLPGELPGINAENFTFPEGDPDPGQLSFQWGASSPADLPDSLLHYQACFEVIDNDCRNTNLEFSPDPTPIEVKDRQGNLVPFLGGPGLFTSGCKSLDREYVNLPGFDTTTAENEYTDEEGWTNFFADESPEERPFDRTILFGIQKNDFDVGELADSNFQVQILRKPETFDLTALLPDSIDTGGNSWIALNYLWYVDPNYTFAPGVENPEIGVRFYLSREDLDILNESVPGRDIEVRDLIFFKIDVDSFPNYNLSAVGNTELRTFKFSETISENTWTLEPTTRSGLIISACIEGFSMGGIFVEVPGIVSVEEPARRPLIRTFPNPAVEWLQVSLEDTEGNPAKAMQISDSFGRLLEAGNLPAANRGFRVNLGQWPAGVYHLSIRFENGEIFSDKFIKR